MKLCDQGKISLSEPMTSYLPDNLIQGIHVHQGTDYSQKITVQQLISQTSGIADYFEGKPKGGESLFDSFKKGQDRAMDIQQVMEIARSLPANFIPGEKGHYSDTNFQLLGAIIEAVTGKSVTENFQDDIFAPLGLQNTYVYNEGKPEPMPFYFKQQKVQIPKFMATNVPDGGVVSTVGENQIFLQAFFDDKLFDVKHLERMTADWHMVFFPMIAYGMGMMRFKIPRLFSPFKPAPELIGHSGSTGSFAFYSPATELYFTGTINQIAAPSKPFQLMTQVMNKIR